MLTFQSNNTLQKCITKLFLMALVLHTEVSIYSHGVLHTMASGWLTRDECYYARASRAVHLYGRGNRQNRSRDPSSDRFRGPCLHPPGPDWQILHFSRSFRKRFKIGKQMFVLHSDICHRPFGEMWDCKNIISLIFGSSGKCQVEN